MAQYGDGRQVVMFGGLNLGPPGVYNQPKNLRDTWIWDGTNWNPATLGFFATLPPARHGASMANDPRTGLAVLFGGVGDNGFLGDTWIFTSRGVWQSLSFPPGYAPSPRALASMAYDPSDGGRIILTGGWNGTRDLQELWKFDIVQPHEWRDATVGEDKRESIEEISASFLWQAVTARVEYLRVDAAHGAGGLDSKISGSRPPCAPFRRYGPVRQRRKRSRDVRRRYRRRMPFYLSRFRIG